MQKTSVSQQCFSRRHARQRNKNSITHCNANNNIVLSSMRYKNMLSRSNISPKGMRRRGNNIPQDPPPPPPRWQLFTREKYGTHKNGCAANEGMWLNTTDHRPIPSPKAVWSGSGTVLQRINPKKQRIKNVQVPIELARENTFFHTEQRNNTTKIT